MANKENKPDNTLKSDTKSRECACNLPKPGDFKQVITLKNSGLTIFIHRNVEVQKTSRKKSEETFILHNTGEKKLKRPDYISEICQYKTKCIKCKSLVQKVHRLIDEMQDIKMDEVLGVCEYCKRSNSALKCRRCEHIVSKYLSLKSKVCQNKRARFVSWLAKVNDLLREILDIKPICKHRIFRDSHSILELEQLLSEFKSPLSQRQPEITYFPTTSQERFVSSSTFGQSKEMLEDILKIIKTEKSKHYTSEDSLSFSRSSTGCVCKYFTSKRMEGRRSMEVLPQDKYYPPGLITSREFAKSLSSELRFRGSSDIERQDRKRSSSAEYFTKKYSDYSRDGTSKERGRRSVLDKISSDYISGRSRGSGTLRDEYKKGKGLKKDEYGKERGPNRDEYEKDRGSKRGEYRSDRGSKREEYESGRGTKRDEYGKETGSRRDEYKSGRTSKRDEYKKEKGSRGDEYGSERGSKRDRYGKEGELKRDEYGRVGGSKRDEYGSEKGSKRDGHGKDRESKRDEYGRVGGSKRDEYGSEKGSKRDGHGKDRESKRDEYGREKASKKEITTDAKDKLPGIASQKSRAGKDSREEREKYKEGKSKQETKEDKLKRGTTKDKLKQLTKKGKSEEERLKEDSTKRYKGGDSIERTSKTGKPKADKSKQHGTEEDMAQKAKKGKKVTSKDDLDEKYKGKLKKEDQDKLDKNEDITKKSTQVKKATTKEVDFKKGTKGKDMTDKEEKSSKKIKEDVIITEKGKDTRKKKRDPTVIIKDEEIRKRLLKKDPLKDQEKEKNKERDKDKNKNKEKDKYKDKNKEKESEESDTDIVAGDVKTSTKTKRKKIQESENKKETSTTEIPIKKQQPSSEALLLLKMMKELQIKKEKDTVDKKEELKEFASLAPLPEIKRKLKSRVESLVSESFIECEDCREREVKKIIFGNEIVNFDPTRKMEGSGDHKPLLFKITQSFPNIAPPHIEPQPSPETKRRQSASGKKLKPKMPEDTDTIGIIRYQLSNRKYIEEGWTILPTTKILRKMNTYNMKLANPEFDFFKINKKKKTMFYDSGEKLAEIYSNESGKWFYKNGNLALHCYKPKEPNVRKRYIVYSSGAEKENGTLLPITILGLFDQLGNAVIYDYFGNARLKYNQSEGVIIDEKVGPPGRWKWHALNDPPVLQPVFIDTFVQERDEHLDNLIKKEKEIKEPNVDMIMIEFENFVREKAHKLLQKFKPFHIRMKAVKINEYFSIRVLDQANVTLTFQDGHNALKLNLGMNLINSEIVDTETSEVSEVATPYDRIPARTQSVSNIQDALNKSKKYGKSIRNRMQNDSTVN